MAGLLASACSGAAPSTDTAACARRDIVGGSAQPGSSAFDTTLASTLASVVLSSGPALEDTALCSGTFVTGLAVLTARHCLEAGLSSPDASAPAPSGRLVVVNGSPLDTSAPKATVTVAWLHEDLDVALLELAWDQEPPVRGALVPLLDEPLDDSWLNAPVELAGYGFSRGGGFGELQFATETIVRIEPESITVDGGDQSGACTGDSGGPLFGTTRDGRVRVLGILKGGDRSCVGQDHYTRVDRLAGWQPLAAALSAARAGCEAEGRLNPPADSPR